MEAHHHRILLELAKGTYCELMNLSDSPTCRASFPWEKLSAEQVSDVHMIARILEVAFEIGKEYYNEGRDQVCPM
jgi:hypothetical protein